MVDCKNEKRKRQMRYAANQRRRKRQPSLDTDTRSKKKCPEKNLLEEKK